MELKDRIAIVTGASSGIGAATAVALARRGTKVTLNARGRARLDEIGKKIQAAGGECLTVPADVTVERDAVALFERSFAHWGDLDILVNAAGIGRRATLHEGRTEDWRAMLETNVLALCTTTREALRRFDETRGGHVVHVSSLSGHRVPAGGRGGGFYAATKFAVRALTEALRGELRARGSRTRVTEISPGFVATNFFEEYFGGDRERTQETLTRHRILDADDVAAAVIYVLEAPEHVAVHDVLLRSNEQLT